MSVVHLMLVMAILASVVDIGCGHGALFIPPPRNAMDNVLPEWADGKAPSQGCTCTNGNGDYKTG